MPGRIFLANVGANAAHRFSSPIFADGTFEFLPIPEEPQIDGPHAVRYQDLRSHYQAEEDLKGYLPKRLWRTSTHNDPEFETFTYGDNCEVNARAASLKRLEQGDFLFFIVRLVRWTDGSSTGNHGFYLIGYLEIEDVLTDVLTRPSAKKMTRFGNNAHIRRGLTDSALWDRFWVFGGSENSKRFRHAVPVTRELAQGAFRSADGSPWRWDGGRTELQVIGSYTRSCRCVIDPSVEGNEQRAAFFWDWVQKHSET